MNRPKVSRAIASQPLAASSSPPTWAATEDQGAAASTPRMASSPSVIGSNSTILSNQSGKYETGTLTTHSAISATIVVASPTLLMLRWAMITPARKVEKQ